MNKIQHGELVSVTTITDCWQYERCLPLFDGTFARRLRNGPLPVTLKEVTQRHGNVFLSVLQSAFGLL
jgi:hypothetical protein